MKRHGQASRPHRRGSTMARPTRAAGRQRRVTPGRGPPGVTGPRPGCYDLAVPRSARARGSLALVLAIAAGCDGLRRPSLRTVDPGLQRQPRLERERTSGGYRLGEYVVERPRLREHAVGEDLGTRPDAPRNPGWRWELELTVRKGRQRWTAHCNGRRVPSIAADYGEIADVTNDEIDAQCDIVGEQRWHLGAHGRLDKNIGGELKAEGGTAIAPLQLEIILWVVRLRMIRRSLAAPVMQLKQDRTAIAAMIVERPQWAWLGAGAPTELQGVALTALAALDALPLGWGE